MIRPCPNQLICPSETPLGNFTSEGPERRSYLGIVYHDRTPPLGPEWTSDGCVETCESTISQEDANLCALRQAELCVDPQLPYYSTQQAEIIYCEDGATFTYVLPAATFVGATQAEADAKAAAYAAMQAPALRYCLSDVLCCICLESSYNDVAVVSGDTQDLTVVVESGSVPPGITVTEGVITDMRIPIAGTPTTAGNYTFALRITDNNGHYLVKTFTLSVIQVATTTLPDGGLGFPYTASLTVIGGSGSYSWSLVSGTLPGGLSLSSDGIISGTPTSIETETFVVRVTDLVNDIACEGSVTLEIRDPTDCQVSISVQPTSLSLTPTQFNAGFVTFSLSFAHINAIGPVSIEWYRNGVKVNNGLFPGGPVSQGGIWNITGATTTTLTIAGAPHDQVTGVYKAKVMDGGIVGCEVETVEVTVGALIVEQQYGFPGLLWDGAVGYQYFTCHQLPSGLGRAATMVQMPIRFQQSGLTGPFTWSVIAGALPPGLSLAAETGTTCALIGTPTLAGLNYTFTVRALEDGTGRLITREFTMNVKRPLYLDDVAVIQAQWNGQSNGILLPARNTFNSASWRGINEGGASAMVTPTPMDFIGGVCANVGYPFWRPFITVPDEADSDPYGSVISVHWEKTVPDGLPYGSFPLQSAGMFAPAAPPDPLSVSQI